MSLQWANTCSVAPLSHKERVSPLHALSRRSDKERESMRNEESQRPLDRMYIEELMNNANYRNPGSINRNFDWKKR